jgi:hypothetical protein
MSSNENSTVIWRSEEEPDLGFLADECIHLMNDSEESTDGVYIIFYYTNVTLRLNVAVWISLLKNNVCNEFCRNTVYVYRYRIRRVSKIWQI